MADLSVNHEKFLISKIKRGDKDAFDFIFYTHYKGLVLYASKYLHDRDEAQETVQGIYVKLWTERERLEIKTSLIKYLQRCVQNKCLDLLKHKKIVLDYENQVQGRSVNRSDATDDLILYDELQVRLENAINELPESCREIFRLSRFDGLKYKEIAEKLNISVKTVEFQIGKALKKLRVDLKSFLT